MDMSQRLEQILGDESAMAQIRQLAQGLGQGGEGGGMDIGGLLAALGSRGTAGNSSSGGNTPGLGLPPPKAEQQGDENVQLLRAIKPFLSQKRRRKVSQAVRMMQLMEMLPLLQQSGMLNGLMGGDEDD